MHQIHKYRFIYCPNKHTWRHFAQTQEHKTWNGRSLHKNKNYIKSVMYKWKGTVRGCLSALLS